MNPMRAQKYNIYIDVRIYIINPNPNPNPNLGGVWVPVPHSELKFH